MKILLTNDDGYEAAGINSLFKILGRSHDVWMIAPDSERSACSNAITIGRDLAIKQHGKKIFSVTGFPADCVNIAVNGDIVPKADLVISGINHGPNLGDDLFFSGTVAGARTAYIFGTPGIAISMDSYHRVSGHFDEASEFLLEFVEGMGQIGNIFLTNINYSDLPRNKIKGVKETFAGKRIYNDSWTRKHHDDSHIMMSMSGEIHSVHLEGSDANALREGYISITPLTVDCTDYKKLGK